MDVPEAVKRALREQGLLSGAERVICALSGGADSVCLADVLLSLAPTLGFALECAHFDHRLRGAESERDAGFVRDWCRERGIPLHFSSGDTAEYAKERGLSLEEAGRDLRYAFLEGLCDEKTVVATAHQAEDQAETILLNLLRGAGLRGLCGIPPRRGRISRPLLELSREEILNYLEERGLSHVEDSSNAVPDVRRNRLRLQVLPLLREMNPSFAAACSRTSRLLRADEDYLTDASAGLWRKEGEEAVLPVSRLLEAPPPLAARALRQAAEGFGVRLEEKHVASLLLLASSDSPSARLSLPGGLTARRRYGELRLGNSEPKTLPFPETELPFGVWTALPDCKWSVFWGDPGERTKINGKFIAFFFKKESICGKMLVRPRRSGDRLRPAGRPEKSLKKWMIEEKIPAPERDRLPVFADEAGVLAVPGLGAAARASAEEERADAVLLFAERT